MKTAALKLYWVEWKAAAGVLGARMGLSKGELDAERKAIHARVLGRDYSSTEIVEKPRMLDAVLGAFRAISRPDDLVTQMRLLGQRKRRIIWVIEKALGEMNAGPDYLAGILRRMSSEGAMPLHATLEDYDFDDLRKVAMAVQRTKRARGRRS